MRREVVLVMQGAVALSQRRACGLMVLHRGTCRYRSQRPEEGQLRIRLRELAEVRRRFSYRLGRKRASSHNAGRTQGA